MNIYFRELKAHRKSLIIWSISMSLLVIGGMGKYSAGLGAGGASINELMGKLPKSLQSLFGVGVFDLSNALDYFGILFLYIILIAAIHAVMLGVGIIAKEERDKTVEFLMVKPVSRSKVITSKLLAALTIVLILNIITAVSSYSILSYYSNQPFGSELIKLMLGMLAIQLLFTILGAFFAAFISKPKLSAAVATGVLMLMFIISVIIDITGQWDSLKYLTFFKLFDAKDILKGGYDIMYPIIAFVFLTALSFGTYFFYKRRDLKL